MLKKLYMLCVVAALTVGVPVADASNVGTVADKMSVNENRFSATDFLFGSGSVTKTVTVFYLIDTRGLVCEVGLSDYQRAKVGKPWRCDSRWRDEL